MVDRRDRRPGDDVPIIGDFSAEHDARIDAESRPKKREQRAAAPQRITPEPMIAERRAPERPAAQEQWRPDPIDLRRRRRTQQREGSGAFARILRYALLAALVAVGVVGYLNFDAVREVGLEVVARVVRTLAERSTEAGSSPSAVNGEPETVVIEGGDVAGTRMPSAIGGAPPTEDAAAPVIEPAAPAPPPVAVEVVPAGEPVAAAAAEPAAVPAPPPEPAAPPPPPPGPETFELAAVVVRVSEAAASARVLVLRSGDRSRASTVVWSTRDGTATAGSDYVDRGAVVERFSPGEQNRTILVPIIGDRNAEGPENFYVVLVPDDSVAAGEVREAEVVIDDDD